MGRRRLPVAAVALMLVACATSAPRQPLRVREATLAEQATVAQALGPLMYHAGFPLPPPCPIGLAVSVTDVISAGVGPSKRCPEGFSLLVTEAALTRLDRTELQAMLAHEIGHVRLGHFASARARAETRENTTTALGVAGAVANAIPFVGPLVVGSLMAAQVVAPVGAELGSQAFNRRDETEADEFAARLMQAVGGPTGCRALATLFERLADEGSRSGGWLSSHPVARGRASAVRTLCD